MCCMQGGLGNATAITYEYVSYNIYSSTRLIDPLATKPMEFIVSP
jgi:hypothetical protein